MTRMRVPRRTLAMAVTALGIALGSGGTSLLLFGGEHPKPASSEAAAIGRGEIPQTDGGVDLRPADSTPVPVHITVPAIHVSSAITELHLQGDGALQVPEDPAQAGWWSGGAAPGDAGPAVIVGHVDSLRGPAVFYLLSALHPGDQVKIGRRDGSTVGFVVEAVRQYPKDAFPTDLVYGPTSQPTLRLLTCGGAFDRATGHYSDNVVVFAHLAPPPAETPRPPAHQQRPAL